METATQTTEETEEKIDESADGEGSQDEQSSPESQSAIERLPGIRKAAILCLSLGEDAASTLFQHLTEDEVQMLSRELALLPDVKSDIVEEVIGEFNQLLLARNYVTTGGVDYAKRLLVRSFGNDAAKKLTDKVVHSLESSANFDTLQQTDP